MRSAILSAVVLIALCGCAGDGYGYRGGFYGGGDIAYYDNSYGAFYDGYWDGDAYYYRPNRHGRYIRDDGHHFRRDRADGFREYRGTRGHRWR